MPKPPFRVLFISTSNVGVSHWRLWLMARGLSRIPGVECYCFIQDYNWFEGVGIWEALGQHDFDNRASNIPIHDTKTGKLLREQLVELYKKADAVVCQTVHYPFSIALLQLCKEKCPKTPLFAECDDYIFDPPSYNDGAKSYERGGPLEKAASVQFRLSDGLIVSTYYLAKLYSHLNKNIHVMPNSIDLEEWDRAFLARKQGDGKTIGWCGGAAHDEDLALMIKPLKRAIRKHKGRFRCIYTGPGKFLEGAPRIDLVRTWLPTHDFARAYAAQGINIGVAPLVENEFNKGKTALKAIEQGALGIPCVASRIEPYKRLIRHGETGFLASTEAEWEEYLGILLDNPDKRRRIGLSARKDIRDRFDLGKTARRYLKVLR